MRHSTFTLTMDTYDHLFPGEEADTVYHLPDVSLPTAEPAKATGTDEKFVVTDTVFASYSASRGVLGRVLADSGGRSSADPCPVVSLGGTTKKLLESGRKLHEPVWRNWQTRRIQNPVSP